MLIGNNPLNEAPEWFKEYIEIEPQNKSVEVEGAKINFNVWGDTSLPGLVLLHGFNAHSLWWAHIAPAFIEDYCVVALDFSGMGDSEKRDFYSQEIYSKEVKGVINEMGWDSAKCLAHSMGGAVSIYSTSLFPNLFTKLILLDSIIVMPPEKAALMSSRRPSSRFAVHSEDLESAISRFRLMPPQPCAKDYVLRHVAKNSYKETTEGWVLKSDPLIPKTYQYNDLHEMFMNVSVDLELIYGGSSQLFTPDVLEYMKYVGNLEENKVHRLDGAMHHLFLDMPQEFIELTKTVLTNDSS